jgi:uncharacterized protein (TIGR03435 family)
VTDATGLTGQYDYVLCSIFDDDDEGTDATGLTGQYDYTLVFLSEAAQSVDSDAPTLVTAIQEQLGLKLERDKGLVDVIFIDHVEKNPTAN